MTPLPLAVDLLAYPTAAIERGRFIQADAAQTAPPEQAPVALAFQIATEHYPLMAQSIYATAKADFVKARATNI